jgi:hypothetical protein
MKSTHYGPIYQENLYRIFLMYIKKLIDSDQDTVEKIIFGKHCFRKSYFGP